MVNRKQARGKKKQVFFSAQPTVENYVHDQVNPFSQTAGQMKCHDDNTSKTFTVQSKSIHNVSVDNAGRAYYEFYPQLAEHVAHVDFTDGFLNGNIIDNAATVTRINASDYSILDNQGVGMRVTSWGLRVTCVQNALEAQGRIVLKELSNPLLAQITTARGAAYTTLSEDNYNEPISKKMDIASVPKSIGTDHYRFIATDTTPTDVALDSAIYQPYKIVGLYIEGAKPSGTANTGKTILTVEVTINLEVLPLVGSLGSRTATPAAPKHTQVLNAVANTRNVLPIAGPAKGPTGIFNLIKSAAKRAVSMAGNFALKKGMQMLTSYVNPGLPLLTNGAKIIELD